VAHKVYVHIDGQCAPYAPAVYKGIARDFIRGISPSQWGEGTVTVLS